MRRQRFAIAQAEIGRPDAAFQHQLGDAVHQRPQPQALGGARFSIRRTSRGSVLQDRISALARPFQRRSGRRILPDSAEHEAAQRRIGDRERHITDAARVQARGSVDDFIHSRGHRGRERGEAALGNRVEQCLLIGKMMIGRRRRDTRAAGNGTQRQCREALVFQDFLRRRDQRVAQAAVMIRRPPLVGLGRSNGDWLLLPISSLYDVV